MIEYAQNLFAFPGNCRHRASLLWKGGWVIGKSNRLNKSFNVSGFFWALTN